MACRAFGNALPCERFDPFGVSPGFTLRLRREGQLTLDFRSPFIHQVPRPIASPTVQAFGDSTPPTMPSADFCTAIRDSHEPPSRESATPYRSPEVSSTAFGAQPPDLRRPPRWIEDFAVACPLVPTVSAFYPVRVPRLAPLLHASFRPRLTTTPLRFANPSPPSGWVEDFHSRAVEHARHTSTRGFSPGPTNGRESAAAKS